MKKINVENYVGYLRKQIYEMIQSPNHIMIESEIEQIARCALHGGYSIPLEFLSNDIDNPTQAFIDRLYIPPED